MTAIPPSIAASITTALAEVEAAHEVTILFAAESGSRAWGFPSPDSDYDVRFVYVHRLDWYLSLEPGRDVIERPIAGLLDINGWDLRKALGLLLRANRTLVEWLVSPILYRDGPERAALRELAGRLPHAQAARYHYLHLGLRQYGRHLAGQSRVYFKKYFYAVLPAAALCWLRHHPDEVPPMDLPSLLAGIEIPADLRTAIDDLLIRKSLASELGEGPAIPVIDGFLCHEFALARACVRRPSADPAARAAAEILFRRIVKRTME